MWTHIHTKTHWSGTKKCLVWCLKHILRRSSFVDFLSFFVNVPLHIVVYFFLFFNCYRALTYFNNRPTDDNNKYDDDDEVPVVTICKCHHCPLVWIFNKSLLNQDNQAGRFFVSSFYRIFFYILRKWGVLTTFATGPLQVLCQQSCVKKGKKGYKDAVTIDVKNCFSSSKQTIIS